MAEFDQLFGPGTTELAHLVATSLFKQVGNSLQIFQKQTIYWVTFFYFTDQPEL